MCLATVYKEADNSVVLRNVSRIDVDGNKVFFRDIIKGCVDVQTTKHIVSHDKRSCHIKIVQNLTPHKMKRANRPQSVSS